MQSITPVDDLHTFPAPGPRRGPGEPIPWRPYRDMVTLVNPDGSPVPDHEKATETCPIGHLPAAGWPAWTDLVTVGLLGRDFEHHIGGAKLGDAYRSIMEREDGEPDMPPEPDDIDGPDAPDALPSWSDHLHALMTTGRSIPLPPISGGSPVEEEPYALPTPADLAEYDEWSRALDDCGDFPRPKGPDDRRRDMAEVLDFYRNHPEA